MSEPLIQDALSRHALASHTDPHLHHRYDLKAEQAAAQRSGRGGSRWRRSGRRAWLTLARAVS